MGLLDSTIIPAEVAGRTRSPFFPTLAFLNVQPAAAAVMQSLKAESDSDLLILGGARAVTTTADKAVGLSFAPLMVRFKNSATGRELMEDNRDAHLETLFGDGRNPTVWPVAFFVRANTALNVHVSSLGGVPYDLRLTFYGFKLPL